MIDSLDISNNLVSRPFTRIIDKCVYLFFEFYHLKFPANSQFVEFFKFIGFFLDLLVCGFMFCDVRKHLKKHGFAVYLNPGNRLLNMDFSAIL